MRKQAINQNDSAMHGLIKGTSDADHSRVVIAEVHERLCHLNTCAWFTRVPSCGNPAGSPSRGEIQQLEEDGFAKDTWEA